MESDTMSGDGPMIDWGSVRSRVSTDPFFFGWVLGEYAATHQMTETQLAAALKCETRSLIRLSLCRLPDDKESSFQNEIRRISDFVSCDADQLVMLLREVIATKKLADHAMAGNTGLLMAARDRQKNENDDQSGGDD